MKKLLIFAAALITNSFAYGQEEPKVKVSTYLETYYSYDFSKPADNNRPGFIYSHNRHNEVNLNLGFIKGSYDDGSIRANLAVMAGTYTNANLAAEPGVLKNIFEANAGVKLSKTANLWLDAGVFSSHLGFESAISKDCWVLTRNISSENTPYYESGAKITYGTADGKLSATALYLNGWQRINRQNGNSQPAGGLQLSWKPVSGVTLNYSNYLGTEGVDSVRVKRFYHNVYAIFQLMEHLGVTVGLDYGTQEKAKGSDEKNEVISPVAIAQYRFTDKWAVAGRIEHYQDKNGIFINTDTPEGFNTTGYSLNIDYAPVANAVLRVEGKVYDALSHNTAITASFAVSF
jgi:hypothetical protein